MIKLYVDAAVSPTTGLAAAGVLIVAGSQPLEYSRPLPASDNHTAEFAAAILGLQLLANAGYAGQNVQLISDSQVLVDALGKGYSKSHAEALALIEELAAPFPLVIPHWQSDRRNRRAHDLALRGLREQEAADAHR